MARFNQFRKELSKKGFTLIELMIVVAIIGILATIAIPSFTRFSCKAKQSEAKANLGSIFTAEKAFHIEVGSYGTLTEINWTYEGTPRYGSYGIGVSGSLTFTATAQGNIDTDSSVDEWSINQVRQLTNGSNDCSADT
ncbi:MAG: prepilin-type N-terminal cleavage/methylation domain-containing protein [bacterium]